LRCNLLAGGVVILVEGLTFPGQIFQGIERWNATGLASVPAGFGLLLRLSKNRLGRYADQLRYIEIGSAPMPLEHKRMLMELLPQTRICMHYGLTEASRAAFIEFHESVNKLESIGKAAPNVEIKIVGEDLDNELPPLAQGRILVRGEMVMHGYWDDPKQQQEVLHGAWLYTGDYGYRDADGYLYLVAREKELINIGGRKVAPSSIEDVLLGHSSVCGCACIGIPDPKGITGEAVKAFLVLESDCANPPDDAELIGFLRGKLEPYMVPVEFCWVKSIPMTFSGKIQRSMLVKRRHGEAC
jgi:long-chain acyl-CoA synthetase